MTTISGSRTSSWTAATSGSSPSNIPQCPPSAQVWRRSVGGEARRQKTSPKLGAMGQFLRFFFERRALPVLSLRKGDVRFRISAIATAKTATKKRRKCQPHSQNQTHLQIILQCRLTYLYKLRDVA